MLFCLKFLQINGRILRRNLHFIEKTMLGRNALPAWFFIVLDLFPDTFSACMRCVNFNFVYFWSYPDLFPHTEKRHLSYLSNILQKEKSAEKSALFHLLSLLPWHQYHALNVARLLQIDVKNPPDWAVRSREYINGFFIFKIAIFSTALVFGNRSMWLSLLIIWNRANLPTVSRLRSEETSPKSHPLDLRDFIHLVFRQIQILLFLLQ